MKCNLLLLLFLTSCWKTEKEATNECYASQIGTYHLDLERTLKRAGNIGSYAEDLTKWKNFEITFLADSTFHTNMQVDFFADTIGTWESGKCGFESPGLIKYYTSKITEQFGTRMAGDSFCTKPTRIIPRVGSISIWFRRQE